MTVQTVTLSEKLLFFSLKVLKATRKEAGTDVVLLFQSRNMVGQFQKKNSTWNRTWNWNTK